MKFGELITIDGKLCVKSKLECHGDDPIEVIRGYESFDGRYWFVTEKPQEDDIESFGFIQGHYNWEWGYIHEEYLKERGNGIWKIKDKDLLYAGKRGD
jgi:hypothetical protein